MKKLILLMFLLVSIPGLSQVSIIFQPTIHGQSLEGLSQMQVINTLDIDLRAVLNIRIRQVGGGEMVRIKTSFFNIRPGAQRLDPSAFANSQFHFYNNNLSSLLAQSRRFPEGEYEYCFEIDISAMKLDQYPPVFDNCFLNEVQPQTPLFLVDPPDEDESCNKRPSFTWQLPVPMSPGSRSRLVLTEINEEQDPVEAITFNKAIINQPGIPGNRLVYPSNLSQLEEGKEYAWQVIVYEGKTLQRSSEVWTFKVHCGEYVKTESGDGYREISEVQDGNYYFAMGLLRFSLRNPYGEGKLNYDIYSVAKGMTPLKGLPTLKLMPGLNKFDIDLDMYKIFKDGEEYLIKIRLVDNRQLSLRFIYKQAEQP